MRSLKRLIPFKKLLFCFLFTIAPCIQTAVTAPVQVVGVDMAQLSNREKDYLKEIYFNRDMHFVAYENVAGFMIGSASRPRVVAKRTLESSGEENVFDLVDEGKIWLDVANTRLVFPSKRNASNDFVLESNVVYMHIFRPLESLKRV